MSFLLLISFNTLISGHFIMQSAVSSIPLLIVVLLSCVKTCATNDLQRYSSYDDGSHLFALTVAMPPNIGGGVSPNGYAPEFSGTVFFYK